MSNKFHTYVIVDGVKFELNPNGDLTIDAGDGIPFVFDTIDAETVYQLLHERFKPPTSKPISGIVYRHDNSDGIPKERKA